MKICSASTARLHTAEDHDGLSKTDTDTKEAGNQTDELHDLGR